MSHLLSGSTGIGYRLELGIGTSGATSSSSSHAPDQKSGGADSLFVQPVSKDASAGNHWGEIEMVFDPSEMDRLDVYLPKGTDPYGAIDGSMFEERTPMEAAGAMSRPDWCFRMGIGPEKILKVRVSNPQDRASILASLKKAGVSEVNGMKVEDLVVVCKGGKQFYETHLKPAGY